MKSFHLAFSKFAIVPMLCLWALIFSRGNSFSQGSLTPPGAPAPTMKSLAQIEPRTDIETVTGDASNLHIITNSGSYYLSSNINGVGGKNGIQVMANNVTIDLNGFTINGGGVGSYGVQGNSFHTNLVVRNGVITRWNSYGLYAANCYGGLFERLLLTQNNFAGLACGRRARVEDCIANSNTGDGFFVEADSLVMNCTSEYNSGAGINNVESWCRIEGNHLLHNGGYGLSVPNGSNLIFRNSAAANGTNYNILSSNISGPINSGLGVVTNSNPWANFSY